MCLEEMYGALSMYLVSLFKRSSWEQASQQFKFWTATECVFLNCLEEGSKGNIKEHQVWYKDVDQRIPFADNFAPRTQDQ